MRIIIYGLGIRYKNNKRYFDEEVVALCDKEAKIIEGPFLLITPNEISCHIYDYIVITTSNYFDEISKELFYKYNISTSKIINLEYYLFLKKGLLTDSDWKKKVSIFCTKPKAIGYFEQYNWRLATQDDLEASSHKVDEHIVNIDGTLLINEYKKKNYINYVVKHKEYIELNKKEYKTIWVGQNRCPSNEYLQDNIGDNIAEYNSLINECTALYWVWKNRKSEYIGLSHYRRYLESPTMQGYPIDEWEVSYLLDEYDIIVSEAECFGSSSNYVQMLNHICKDAVEDSIPCMRESFRKIHPEDEKLLDMFLEGNVMFPCQMFVMDSDKLNEYCSWLFPILFYMIEHFEIKEEWDDYSKRIIGFWAERMLTIWLLKTNYTIYECPIILLDDLEAK